MVKNLRGMGRIFRRKRRDPKTKKRKYFKVWWVQYSHNGHQIRKSSKSTNRTDAVRFLKKQIELAQAGKLVVGAGARLNFDKFCELLVVDYSRRNRRSLDRAEDGISHLKTFFCGIRPNDITTSLVKQYEDLRFEEKAASATVKYELALLKRMFRLAGDMIGRVPSFPTISVSNVRTGFFEVAEFEALLPHLEPDLQAPITFAYLTGWRLKSEVFSLKWSQVDFTAGEIRLEPGTTKNDEGRIFPFSTFPELKTLLENQRQLRKELELRTGQIIPWVFHREGNRIKDIRGAWSHALQESKIGQRIPHDFRRTAVRNLERAGVPRSVAMKLVGHKTEAMYRRYAIVAKQDLVDGLKRLSDFRAAEVEEKKNNKVVTKQVANAGDFRKG